MDNIHEMDYREGYTTWRRVMAWTGFITMIVLVMVGIALVVWANGFIDANLAI